jgi:hypothetical protein
MEDDSEDSPDETEKNQFQGAMPFLTEVQVPTLKLQSSDLGTFTHGEFASASVAFFVESGSDSQVNIQFRVPSEWILLRENVLVEQWVTLPLGSTFREAIGLPQPGWSGMALRLVLPSGDTGSEQVITYDLLIPEAPRLNVISLSFWESEPLWIENPVAQSALVQVFDIDSSDVKIEVRFNSNGVWTAIETVHPPFDPISVAIPFAWLLEHSSESDEGTRTGSITFRATDDRFASQYNPSGIYTMYHVGRPFARVIQTPAPVLRGHPATFEIAAIDLDSSELTLFYSYDYVSEDSSYEVLVDAIHSASSIIVTIPAHLIELSPTQERADFSLCLSDGVNRTNVFHITFEVLSLTVQFIAPRRFLGSQPFGPITFQLSIRPVGVSVNIYYEFEETKSVPDKSELHHLGAYQTPSADLFVTLPPEAWADASTSPRHCPLQIDVGLSDFESVVKNV